MRSFHREYEVKEKMRHNFLSFIFLMVSSIGNADSMPGKDQTINFIENTINENLTVLLPAQNCADLGDRDKRFSDLDYLRLNTKLYYNNLRLTLNSDTCSYEREIPLEGLERIVLLSSDNLSMMLLCDDKKNCIKENFSFYSKGLWVDGELMWRDRSNKERSFHLMLGENSKNNLKVSRRLFNALKHYAALHNKEFNNEKDIPQIKAKFKDNSFEKVDGSAFD